MRVPRLSQIFAIVSCENSTVAFIYNHNLVDKIMKLFSFPHSTLQQQTVKQTYINIVYPSCAVCVSLRWLPNGPPTLPIQLFMQLMKFTCKEHVISAGFKDMFCLPMSRTHCVCSGQGHVVFANVKDTFLSISRTHCVRQCQGHVVFAGVKDGHLASLTLCPSAKHYNHSHYDIHSLYGHMEAIATHR